MDSVVFVNKWIHLLSIIGVLGGVLFSRLLPSEDEPWRRWVKFQLGFWILALVTGFINFAFVNGHVNGTYQMYFGMKAMLAIIMFLTTLALAINDKVFQKRAVVSNLLLVLGIAIVGFSATLNIGRVKRTMTVEAPPVASQPTNP